MSETEVRKLDAPTREEALIRRLDEQAFLLVLDGLERILLAYSRVDAAHLADDDLDGQGAATIAEVQSLSDKTKDTYLERHRLRQCTDPRIGLFLRRLSQVCASRVLISTRLYPVELQTQTAQPLPGCYPEFLDGLPDDDALSLWSAFGASGTSEQLLPLFNAFDNYPLFLRALAGEVADFRPAPGNFDRWQAANPDFNPASLSLKNAKTHVLEFALRGLDEKQRRVLHTIAAFRMPATWETLRALLIPEPSNGITKQRRAIKGREKLCSNDQELDIVLTELEDRGLVGWDKQANRYDLHPIVRNVVWKELSQKAKLGVYKELNSYLESLPSTNQDEVKNFDELSTAIELYYNLICLERFDDAFNVFRSRFEMAAIYRLSYSRPCIELLKLLFPDGVDKLPRLTSVSFQVGTLNALAQCYHFCGEPRKSAPLYARAAELIKRAQSYPNFITLLYNSSWTLRPSGDLRKSETCSREALFWARKLRDRPREAVSIQEIGLTLEVRGAWSEAKVAFERSTHMFKELGDPTYEGIGYGSLAQLGLRTGELVKARKLVDRAWKLALHPHSEKDLICAARIQGEIALALGDLPLAFERLNYALMRARVINFIEEELPTLTALAQWHWQKKEYAAAREFLNQIWASAERGPYPPFHADAWNVLARIEKEEGHLANAIAAAIRAYELAWCDGPPYAYYFGLANAKQLLLELDTPEPKLSPFKESKFEPMVDIELNPKDEFYIESKFDSCLSMPSKLDE